MTLAYGGLFSEEIQVITVPSDGVPAIIALPEAMMAENITLGTNNMTITLDGNYKVDFSAVMQSTSGTFGVVPSVRVNGIEIAALSPGIVLDDQFLSIATSAIIPLAAGDILDLALYSATGGNVLLGPSQNATLVATLLGPSA